MNYKFIELDTVDSTNSYAYELADKGQAEITVITARNQTNGKGKMGRHWQSTPGESICVSFILHPEKLIKDIIFLPIIFSLGVVKTIEKIVIAKLKWPNDIYVNNKKISGVLVETKSAGELCKFAVAGVGVNLNNDRKKLLPKATSLFNETGKKYDREKFLSILIDNEIKLYKEFKSGKIKELLEKAQKYMLPKKIAESRV